MKRRLLLLIAAFGLAAGTAAPASAILNGTPDGTRHPYVGMMYTNELFCSGSAISPTVFLTADHCIEDTTEVYVTFDANPQPRDPDDVDPRWPEGWPHPDAAWTTGTAMQIGDVCFRFPNECPPGLPGFFSTSDVAVVILDEPVDLPRYAQLPEPDQVRTLTTGTPLTAVGYGGDTLTRGNGQPMLSVLITRKSTTNRLLPTQRAIDEVAVRAHTNGQSGTCSGDSGSPLLLGDTVLGVLSGGPNRLCSAPSYYSRVDNDILPLLQSLID
jgi:hypothetical protein